MLRAILANLLLVFSTASAFALPKPGDTQPDCIHFGNVYTGAIVEGSFQVYETGQNADIPFAVTAPKFVKVRKQATEARQFGTGNNFICGSVEEKQAAETDNALLLRLLLEPSKGNDF